MKHEIKLLGCWHVAIFVASLILSLILIYVTLNLNSGLTNLNLRYQELVTQTDLYQKVLADKTNLKLAIDHIQQDIQPYLMQHAIRLDSNKRLTEALYLTQLVELAQQVGLAVVGCDPVTHWLNLTGDFQQLIFWLEKLQTLDSEFFCKQLLINKTQRSLHIDYMYDMHTLAGLA
ncbi:MAG TPA: hypothetical protein VJJ81_04005 [Candidatus Babeliales bacterium]|nr:hypothetical protein [Candidatus Babeliales bacterium]